MPNDDFVIICPYYHKTLGNTVFCTGITADGNLKTEGQFIKQCFENRKERNLCFKKYCTTFRFPDCRIARLNIADLNKKP